MNDENVDQATLINGCEASSGERLDETETHRNLYRRLAIANSLDWNGSWRDEKRATTQDNHAIVDAVAAQLELTPYQKDEAHASLDSLPRELLGAYQSYLLALCICGVVGRRDGRDYHPNKAHPNADTDSKFGELFEDTDSEYSKLYSCWNRIDGEL